MRKEKKARRKEMEAALKGESQILPNVDFDDQNIQTLRCP